MPISLGKIVRWDREGDYWNSFIEGSTKLNNSIETNPLAFLPFRTCARSASRSNSTYGMKPIPDKAGCFNWHARKLKQNPNEKERPFRPVVHEEPMYPDKDNFSKHQSTTGIWPENGIMPPLFGAGRRICVGMIFPYTEEFCLPNRFLIQDGGTALRPYDRPGWNTGRPLLPSLTALLLASNPRRYTEILARLRCFSGTIYPLPQNQPAILVHYDTHLTRFLTAVLLGIIRGFDFILAIQRKFRICEYSTHLAIYKAGSTTLGDFYHLERDPKDFISQIIPGFNPALMNLEQKKMFSLIKLQQALVDLNRGKSVAPGWDEFLQFPKSEGPSYLYGETLQTFSKFRSHASSPHHEYYQALFASLFIGDIEKNIRAYAFKEETDNAIIQKKRIMGSRDPGALSYLDGRNGQSLQPIMRDAIVDENWIVVENLIGGGVLPTNSELFDIATQINQTHLIGLCVSKNPRLNLNILLNMRGDSLLTITILSGNWILAKILINAGAKPNISDLFHIVTYKDPDNLIALCLAKHPDLLNIPKLQQDSFLGVASIFNHSALKERLIGAGATGSLVLDPFHLFNVVTGNPTHLPFLQEATAVYDRIIFSNPYNNDFRDLTDIHTEAEKEIKNLLFDKLDNVEVFLAENANELITRILKEIRKAYIEAYKTFYHIFKKIYSGQGYLDFRTNIARDTACNAAVRSFQEHRRVEKSNTCVKKMLDASVGAFFWGCVFLQSNHLLLLANWLEKGESAIIAYHEFLENTRNPIEDW